MEVSLVLFVIFFKLRIVHDSYTIFIDGKVFMREGVFLF
jgi:hypothetical protein